MASPPPIVFPPPAWTNKEIIVYHGTMDTFAPAIASGRIAVGLGKPNTDFGPGFYTTTSKRQAQTWAAQISATRSGTTPAVIKIKISRLRLAKLDTIAFVRGDFAARDYWSLIHYCRKGALDHGRPGPTPYYDVVYGPVAAFWNQRMIIAGADQISFHTVAAETVLNSSFRRRII
jgi:hypothetical protein